MGNEGDGNRGGDLRNSVSCICTLHFRIMWIDLIVHLHTSLSENYRAKSGAQRTLVGGVGLVLSAMLARWLGSADVSTALGLYCLLTVAHLFSNYQALKLISLDWLNEWRLHLIVDEFLKCIGDFDEEDEKTLAKKPIVVSDPVEVSRREPLLFHPSTISVKSTPFMYPIRMGVSFNELCQLSFLPQLLLQSHLNQIQREDNYILTVGQAKRKLDPKRSILVSFFSNSSNVEKAKAYLHGCLVRRTLVSLEADRKTSHPTLREVDVVQKGERIARDKLDRLWPVFKRSLASAGWKLDKTECATEGYELFFVEKTKECWTGAT